ncbi:hypothetical protein [Phenylobacterium sp.]|uniref:hypothetical protein n=1 Tax=Phenylobacterium sp. TaxID=1871053 RepID=UPI002F91D3F5
MTRHLDKARNARRAVRTRLVKGLARCRRALRRRDPAPAAAAAPAPFAFPHLRTLYRQELQRLERNAFPMWRPDPARVHALQSHCA